MIAIVILVIKFEEIMVPFRRLEDDERTGHGHLTDPTVT